MLAKRIFGFRVVLGLPAVRCFTQTMFSTSKLTVGGYVWIWKRSYYGVSIVSLRWFSIGAAFSAECRLVLVIWQPIISCLVIGIFGSFCRPFLYTTVKIAPVYSPHLLRRDGTVER